MMKILMLVQISHTDAVILRDIFGTNIFSFGTNSNRDLGNSLKFEVMEDVVH